MNDQRILDELVTLLETSGVKIRSEPLGGTGGGLCSIKGENTFFFDTDAGCADMAAACAEAIVKLLDIETVYLRPEVRRFVEIHVNRAI